MRKILYNILLIISLTSILSIIQIWSEKEEHSDSISYLDYFVKISMSEVNTTEVDEFAKE